MSRVDRAGWECSASCSEARPVHFVYDTFLRCASRICHQCDFRGRCESTLGSVAGPTPACGVDSSRSFDWDRRKFRLAQVLIHMAKLGVDSTMGLIEWPTLWTGTTVALAAVLFSFLLKSLLKKVPYRVFARVGYGAMTAAGLALLGSSVSKVIKEDRVGTDYRPVLDGVSARVE